MSLLTLYAINPTGMFSYGLCEDNIHLLNKGLVHLQGINEDKGGDSNGSGKSSLFYSICELLFQKNPTELKDDNVINSVWNQGMAGRLLFMDSSQTHYRITYCRKWKKAFYEVDNDSSTNYVGTGLFLDKFDSVTRQWKDFRGPTMKDTREKIQDIIGLTYSNFLAIAYMSPRVGSKFLRGTNKDRMVILSGITGVEEWDLIQDRCRVKKKSLLAQSDSCNLKMSHENGSIETLRSQLESLKSFNYAEKLADVNEEIVDLRKQFTDSVEVLRKSQENYNELCAERDKTLNQDVIDDLKAQESTVKVKLSEVERQISPRQVTADAQLVQEYNKLQSNVDKPSEELSRAYDRIKEAIVTGNPDLVKEHEKINGMLNKAEGSLSYIMTSGQDILDMSSCPTCAQEISSDKKQKIIDEREQKLDEVRASIASYNGTLTVLRDKIEIDRKANQMKLEEVQEQIDRYLELKRKSLADLKKKVDESYEANRQQEEDRISGLQTQAQLLRNKIQGIGQKLTEEYEAYSSYGPKIQEAHEQVNRDSEEKTRVNQLGLAKKSEIEMIEQKIKDIDALEGQIKDKKAIVKTYRDQIKAYSGDINVYEWLIQNIPSIKLLKLSEAMKEISDLANEFLSNMGDSMRVNVSAFAEKVSKKNAASTMDMLKNEVNLEIHDGNKNIHPKLYSEGEIAKVSLAVAKAMHEMARKSGQGCNLMLMDEIFGYMDSPNAQRVAQSIQSILSKGTILITDNSDKVNDLVNFNATWTARKSNGCTKMENGIA